LTDSSGLVTDTYDYDSFGNVLATTGTTPNLYRFSGEQMDSDLGLYYLRARYYNPQTGRFMRRDPLPAISGDITNQHRYLYAAADPVNNADPTGMDAFAVYGKTAQWIVTGLVVFTAVAIFDYQHPTIDGVDLLPNLHIPPVKINLPAWDAKCIGDRVDSIMAVAAATAGVTATVVKCSIQARRQPGKCPPGSQLDDHHLLPFKFLGWPLGLDIEMGWLHRCCRKGPHSQLSRPWQDAWKKFFEEQQKPSVQQVMVELFRLLTIEPFKNFFENDCFLVPGGGSGISW
jgi:RHS repeat-associated protein